MGRLVGATSSETPNRVTTHDGQSGNLSCAGDILLSSLYSDLKGTSKCLVCGRQIEVKVRRRKVVEIRPRLTKLHFVRVPTQDPTSFGVDCENTFLFDRDECLDAWLETHPNVSGRVLDPQHFIDEVAAAKGMAVAPESKQEWRGIKCADCECSRNECQRGECFSCTREVCCCVTPMA